MNEPTPILVIAPEYRVYQEFVRSLDNPKHIHPAMNRHHIYGRRGFDVIVLPRSNQLDDYEDMIQYAESRGMKITYA